MKVYGAKICIDCRNYIAIQEARGFEAEFVDIIADTTNLKEFLSIRDKDPLFTDVRERGGIGIPLFVHEDGRKTFDIDQAFAWIGQAPVKEEEIVEHRTSCEPVGDSLDRFEFRSILPAEVDQAIEIEQCCFPANEACSPKAMTDRIAKAARLFLVAVDKSTGRIAGFLNGVSTDEERFRDEFFTDISLCNLQGKNIMLLGLDVLPEYRKQGLAREIMNQYCSQQRELGRNMLVLTCLPGKVEMYKKFGFTDLGVANSTWGGEEWHEMIYVLS